MEKLINIDGKTVGFKATGATVLLYREKFGADLFADMGKMKIDSNGQLSGDTQCLNRIAYIMARQYDPAVPDDPLEWFDSFEMFSLINAFPQIIELWGMSNKTLTTPKKKAGRQSGK